MKKLLILLVSVLVLGIGQTAFAIPFIPSVPNDEPLYFKFNNYEQLSASGNIQTPDGNTEQNWGILNVSSIATGDLSNLPSGIIPNSQLFNRGDAKWSDTSNEEITGIFYGIKPDGTNVTDAIASTGGTMDLYYDVKDDFSANYIPANRTADNMYTGATEGVFLVRIEFLNGAISQGNANTSIVGSVAPSSLLTGVSGYADSFGSVVADVDGDGILYEPEHGAWAQFLDTDWFDTLLGLNTADFRFKNSFNYNAQWTVPGTDIIGATSDDPARAYSEPIPEPATMLLLGAGLLGLAGFGRRKFLKKD